MGSRIERMGKMRERFKDSLMGRADRVIDVATGYKIQFREPELKLPSIRPYVCGYIQELQQRAIEILYPTETTRMEPNISLHSILTSQNQVEDLTTLFATGELLPYLQMAQSAYESRRPFRLASRDLRLALAIEEGIRMRDWVKQQSDTSGQEPHTILPPSPLKRVSPQRVLYKTIALIDAVHDIPTDSRELGLMLRGNIH